jgi:hypothetical protein
MRTTIEIKDDQRAKLLEIAARRGEKGFSKIIGEAIEMYLESAGAGESLRRTALRLRGKLGRREAERLREETTRIRGSWR